MAFQLIETLPGPPEPAAFIWQWIEVQPGDDLLGFCVHR